MEMTMRKFMEAVIAETENATLAEFAQHEIDKLDAKNKKRQEKPSKASIENIEIKAHILDFLKDKTEPLTANEIAEQVGTTRGKVAYILSHSTDEIAIEKVKSTSGKGKVNGYKLA